MKRKKNVIFLIFLLTDARLSFIFCIFAYSKIMGILFNKYGQY